MTTKTKRRGIAATITTPGAHTSHGIADDRIIQQQFERGSMIAAIVMALFFGAAMLMWAVCAV